jgi:crotonobetainyl-CoA:carnitine CoA-transferase CaiB-like acyl-CoA transferase
MGKHVDGHSLYAASILRNKKLVCLDLRKQQARDVVSKLATNCDIVVENFRPGTLEKWGIGYEQLSALNPKLIMVRISGFGQTGPYRERPGYGFLGDAVGGMLHINGYPDLPPVRAAVPVTDMLTAVYGALGAVMSLLSRGVTGKGQVVDASLYESSFSLMESHVIAYDQLGVVANRAGTRLPGSTPNSLYPTADGEYIAMAASSDPVFKRLAQTMGQSELSEDPRFSSAMARVEHQDVLDDLIGQWTSSMPINNLEALLHQSDVPASKVFTMADIFQDTHFHARQSIVRAPHDALGLVAMAAPAPRLSSTPGEVRHAGRHVGANTREVLSKIGGFSESDIDSFLHEKAAFQMDLP